MALKIFCDACQRYIRDAHRNDDLTGNEVCSNCAGKMEATFNEVTKIEKRCISAIQKQASNARAQLEEAMRRVIDDGKNKEELGD